MTNPHWANPQGFPVPYERIDQPSRIYPGVPRHLWYSVMEDGRIGLFIGFAPGVVDKVRPAIECYIILAREDMDQYVADAAAFWEHEKAHPLTEHYREIYDDLERRIAE